MTLPTRVAAAAILVGSLIAPGVASARMSIIYDEQDAVRTLTDPAGAGPAIGADRGAFRQDPGPGGIFDPQARDAAYRIAKLPAAAIDGLSAEAMADRIQDEIDDPEIPNTSGLVAIDEIGNRFNDGRVRITRTVKSVRGKRIRLAAGSRLIVTKNGYRIERGSPPLPAVSPASPGARLSVAMEMLAARPHPTGGTYADRVHLYIAPAFSTSIAMGRGPHHHLGNDGLPHRATWRGVMPALARAGGVWIEMYHSFGGEGITPMTAREWRRVPAAFSGYAGRFGADAARMHLLMTAATATPSGASGCGDAMQCQWQLAASTPAGSRLLANGPGAYRVGDQAAAWRAEFNRVFGAS